MPGGVCQDLDYEVEDMAEYVSEMATRIVMPHNSVDTAFRKFVSQILTSTRLPRTTILLGMNYLSKRVNSAHSSGRWNPTEGQIWRMLTIALLLGSKFLDDNTFQNKSWSEVSGIPVRELNTLETEWLLQSSWGLYVNLDESSDYKAWLQNWDEWLALKKRRQAEARATRERMALVPPIDTNVASPGNFHRAQAWHSQQIAEYERYARMKRNQAAPSAYQHDGTSWGYQPEWVRSTPLTPPDSGYCTPEYSNSATSWTAQQYAEWFDRVFANNLSRYSQQTTYNGFQPNPHQPRNPPGLVQPYKYGHGAWDMSSPDSNTCSSFHSKAPTYFANHGYSMPVVG
ncbi:hypothetical protein QBC47DRAFT_422963 [Echria macrotheca]|uniref:Uncharacterized protein n=1 Tax=Echria macrotheca TaxID=438768 RepID=A0AAJ0BCQ9_9PEZI|nr:hypothetical protein QBC47DRAFT_422963 [Echria macrotheca]